jgi:hypothetical protein
VVTTWGVHGRDDDGDGRDPSAPRDPMVVLSRPRRRLRVSRKTWRAFIVDMTEWAWLASRPPDHFTRTGVDVSAEDAAGLHETGDRMLRRALRERRGCEDSTRLEALIHIVEFLEGGAFRIEKMPRAKPNTGVARLRRRPRDGSDG